MVSSHRISRVVIVSTLSNSWKFFIRVQDNEILSTFAYLSGVILTVGLDLIITNISNNLCCVGHWIHNFIVSSVGFYIIRWTHFQSLLPDENIHEPPNMRSDNFDRGELELAKKLTEEDKAFGEIVRRDFCSNTLNEGRG